MVSTFFTDELINATELRKNQKHWLDMAFSSPVSIRSGNKKLVLINRDYAKAMCLLNHYAKMIIQFGREQMSNLDKSAIFPWIEHLSKEEIEEFRAELLATFEDTIHNKKWYILEEMLEAWAATAEAKTNPEMLELLNSRLDNEEFTTVE